MADFICDRQCTYQRGNECQLGLQGLSGEITMPGFCPKLNKNKHVKLESEI